MAATVVGDGSGGCSPDRCAAALVPVLSGGAHQPGTQEQSQFATVIPAPLRKVVKQ